MGFYSLHGISYNCFPSCDDNWNCCDIYKGTNTPHCLFLARDSCGLHSDCRWHSINVDWQAFTVIWTGGLCVCRIDIIRWHYYIICTCIASHWSSKWRLKCFLFLKSLSWGCINLCCMYYDKKSKFNESCGSIKKYLKVFFFCLDDYY